MQLLAVLALEVDAENAAGAQAAQTADTAASIAVPAVARGENFPMPSRYCWGASPAAAPGARFCAAAAIISRACGAESGSQSTS